MSLLDDAISIFDFESGSGTTDTKGVHTLTANGGATISNAYSPPQGSNAGLVDGSGDYWSLADDAHFDFTGDYSVAFWMRAEALGEVGLVEKLDFATDGNGWAIRLSWISSDYCLCVYNFAGWGQGGGNWDSWSIGSGWYHIVVIYSDSANTIKLYASAAGGSFGDQVNGTTVSCTLNPAASTAPLWIGAGYYGQFNGRLDEVAFFNKALSAAEAESIFKGTGSGGWREVVGTLNQEGFRFRNDDGDEAGATWLEAQDTNVTAPLDTNTRIRFIVDGTGDPAATQFQLEAKLSTDSDWFKVA